MFRKPITFPAKIILLVISIVLFSVVAFAQSQATTGNIEGRITDQNGAGVSNVTVTARNQATSFEKVSVSDAEGNYRILLLSPGKYSVTTKASGFADAKYENVTVTVGGQTPLDIQLSVGGTTAVVDVEAEGQIVETGRTSVSSTVNERAIENLPINGRNYLDFATLTPAVVRDPTRQGDLAVGGQKGTFNSLQVDGADNNNTFFGQALGRTGVRPPYQFSEESVQEFQVNQNGFSAEFGRSAGAVINVVTKSGTNDWHGSAFYYFRDEALNSNTPILTARNAKRPKSQIKQFGATIGGPIKRDRAFFFFAYDGQRSNIPNVLDPPNFSAQPANIRALLAPKLGTYNVGRDQDVYMVKSDINPNDSNQLVIRFNQQNFTGNNNENFGPLSVEEHSGNSIAKTTTLSANLTSTINSRLINEFRFQFARDREPGEANSTQPETRIQTGGGFLQLGRNNFSPRETTIKRAQFIDALSYTRGRHNFKFGLDFNFDRVFNFFPGLFSGQYTFNSYALFASTTVGSFTQNFAGAGTDGAVTRPNFNEYAFFAQDDWRVTPKLTLNLGIRYDLQDLSAPTVKNTSPILAAVGIDTTTRVKDNNNIAPRFGFSYAFNERTVARGGFGIFYARTPSIMLATSFSQNGIQVTGVTLTPAQMATIGLTYPNILNAPPNIAGVTANPSLYVFSRDYAQPYVQQGRLGVEHEFFKNFSVTATYLMFRGVHLSRTRDVNLSVPVATAIPSQNGQTYTVLRHPSTRPIVSPPNSGLQSFTRISLFESTADSFYNALAIEAKRRFTDGLQFLMVYTYSKAKDNKPDQTMVVVGADDSKGVENNLNVRADYGLSDLDIPHRFVFSPLYEVGKFSRSDNPVVQQLLGNWVISGIFVLQSGFTYSATITGDANRDGNPSTDRVPGTLRNGFRTPNVYAIDARATKSFTFSDKYKLSLVVEAFNLFNRSNIATVNTAQLVLSTTPVLSLNVPAVSTPFGSARTFIGERQVQLAVRFKF
jgi:outer membrane receptor protein involved in Fe transport